MIFFINPCCKSLIPFKINNTVNKTLSNMQLLHETIRLRYLGFSISLFFSSSAIVANVIVLVMILRKKQQRTSFDLVIASLSITDFSTSICSFTFNAYQVAILIFSNETGKHYRQSYMALDATMILFYLSLMHVLLITFLRFSALFWPLKFRQVVTKALIKGLIASTWTLAVISGVIIIGIQKRKGLTGIIFLAAGGLVCCTYAMIATRICILSKTSQSATNNEHRVLFNSFGVAITFFGCMLPFACFITGIEVFQNIDFHLALSFITINFLADPLLYFYFSYWLSKRDEMRRIRNNFSPVQGQNVNQSEETHV